jgi:hypothetical protein
MLLKLGLRTAALATIVSCGLIGQVVLAGPAGAVTVAKAELRDGQLRLEGESSPGVFVSAESTTSVADVRADPTGHYRIQGSNFTAPDCKITISDGGRTPTVTLTLDGCTTTVTPPVLSQATPPPTGSCIIVHQPTITRAVGIPTAIYFDTTGCNTTFNSGATPTPVQWKVVAGSIPTGMTGPASQGTTAGNIIGTPSIPGIYQFTLQVTDQVGDTDQDTLTVSVE